ncbi:hypothetical protein LLH32_11505 [Bacillus nakamurai]|nr:hypothetical protein [Bacillus nakamurai]
MFILLIISGAVI